MLIRFATGAFLGIFPACGAQVDDGGTTGSPSIAGSVSAAGGNASASTGVTVGGTSALTGGSTTIDVTTYCNGLLYTSPRPCDVEQFVNVTNCDIPLQQSPPDPTRVQVAADCALIASVAPDAGTANGYYIDYSDYPLTRLVVTGSTCANLLTNGTRSLVVAAGCAYIR